MLGSSASRGLHLADLNGSGDLDLIVANGNSQANRVYRNDGVGGFTDTGQALGAVDSIEVDIGDVDGDGDLDAIFGNRGANFSTVYTNDGNGFYADTGQRLGVSPHEDVVLGDVDAVFASSGNPNELWFHDTMNCNLLCGDCDRDGDIDVVDALRAAQIANGLIMPTLTDFLACNVDDDGDIDVIDALLIARVSAGFPLTLNCPIP